MGKQTSRFKVILGVAQTTDEIVLQIVIKHEGGIPIIISEMRLYQ